MKEENCQANSISLPFVNMITPVFPLLPEAKKMKNKIISEEI